MGPPPEPPASGPTPPPGPPSGEVDRPVDRPVDRVVAQARFDPIPRLVEPGFVSAFRLTIEREYPRVSLEHARMIALASEGVVTSSHAVWHFRDADEQWRLSLASDLIALETTVYRSRWDFLARLERALLALHELLDPATIERMNLRTIDRIVSAELPNPQAKPAMQVFESVEFAEVVYAVEVQAKGHLRGFGPGPLGAPARPPPEPVEPTTREAIMQLRELSGLTWAELAQLFGVSRRALHHWGQGKAPSLDNEARLREVLGLVRACRRARVSETRRALLAAVDGVTPFELLLERRDGEARQLLDGTSNSQGSVALDSGARV